jgi:F-type H+-transporting ATPase subunit delta
MRNLRAAYRYALAVISVAEEFNSVDAVSADFGLLEKMIADVREFVLFLRSPVVNQERKKSVLAILLKGNVGELTSKFVLLLASKGREGLLPEIIGEFYRLRDERRGIVSATARSATKFTAEQERELVRRLEAATGRKARVRYELDPSLRGGFTVQHGDTVWDASVQHQLDRLEQQFAEAAP